MKKFLILTLLVAFLGILGVSQVQAGFFDEFNLKAQTCYGVMKADGITIGMGFDFYKWEALRAGLGYIAETKIVYGDCGVNLKDLSLSINKLEWLLADKDIVIGLYVGGQIETGLIDYGVLIQIIKFVP